METFNASLRNSTEDSVHQIVQGISVLSDLIPAVRYCAAVVLIIINASITIAFLVQKVRRPKSAQVSPAGLLVLNLLLVDNLLGGVILYNVATVSTVMAADFTWCSGRLSISFFATIGSHIALLNVIIDRFIAIVYTLKYRELMTWRRSVMMVCCGWIIPVAGAVAVAIAVIATQDTSNFAVRCSNIYGSKVFLRFVWIPIHFSTNLCVIIIQYRVYLYLKRHDKRKATCNQVYNASDKSAWVLFRITTPTYLAMLFLDMTKIAVMMNSTEVLLKIYQLMSLFVQITFLTNPLVYAYATGNIRRPVAELCDDVKKWLRPEKEVSSKSASDAVWAISDKKFPAT